MRVLYRHAAFADATGPDIALEQSLLVVGGRIEFLGPDDDAPVAPPDCRVVDASGATIVPGLVDSHSHTVLPGGARWVERIGDDTGELLKVAEENGALARSIGIRWLRDLGAPQRDGRALSLRVRDAWAGRDDRPYIRAAGSWIAAKDTLPTDVGVEALDGDELVAAVQREIESGADLIKLYLDGPDRDIAPWTASEVTGAVAAAHSQGLRVTAHATTLAGAKTAVAGGVDSVEHGHELDEALVANMAERRVWLVPTLAVFTSWGTFTTTTALDRFRTYDGRRALLERAERAHVSVRLAHAAGVPIAAGTDFGGGSLRANQLPWEIEMLVGAGLEPWQALAAATWIGGDLLDEPEAGRLREGGPADFVLVHGNPLDDPSVLWRTWVVV